MSPRTVERVEDWETVPFDGGYAGLHALADEEFSGVVTVGPARLCMIRGTAVGVLRGTIENFADATGTAREAPHESLALLAYMQENADEVRAKYYTEDTPISEVDRTLADGGFTGYVELAENVLSGDYYQVYHAGRSMSVAFVGTAERLLTDEEAFEQANDEVGIYEVYPVEVDPIEIPEPEAGAGVATEASGAAGGDPDPETAEPESDGREVVGTPDDAVAESGPEPDDETGAEPDLGTGAEPDVGAGTEPDAEAATDRMGSDEGGSSDARPGGTEAGAADARASDATRTDAGRPGSPGSEAPATGPSSADSARSGSPGEGRSQSGSSSTAASQTGPGEAPGTGDRGPSTADTEAATEGPSTGTTAPDAGGAGGPGQAGSGAERSHASARSPAELERRAIPSIDPDRTRERDEAVGTPGVPAAGSGSDSGGAGGPGSAGDAVRDPAGAGAGPAPGDPDQSTSSKRADSGANRQSAADDGPPSDQRVEELREELERVESERDDLENRLEAAESDRDRLQEDLEEARSDLEDLRAEVERLEEQRAAQRPGSDDGGGRQLTPAEAIEETNLFVRYRSKGDATLEAAKAGEAERTAVAENLQLEYHTQFDSDAATVGDRPFSEFLTGSVQYRFVDWLVGNLLYEIRETGNTGGLSDLYEVLPKVDRAELNGLVSVDYTEDGEEHRSQEQFDVVVRDRLGNPLFVAMINASREPATESMMRDLVQRTERVGSAKGSLAGAFLVTESFFEPEALATAEEATSSGLLSRDKRLSFVNLSRKDGYHLCLVEARNREFHLAVPEL